MRAGLRDRRWRRWSSGCRGRRVCREPPSTSTTSTSTRPRPTGVCDVDGSELYQRDDDREDVGPGALPEAVGGGGRRRCSTTTTAAGLVVRIDAVACRASRSAAESTRLIERPGEAARDRPQDRRPRSRRWRGRGAWSPRRSSCWSARPAPGVTLAELDRDRRGVHPRRGGVPTFKGYRGFPGSICASPNDMVVHGIPGPYALARRRPALDRRRRHAATATSADSAITVPIGDGAARRLRPDRRLRARRSRPAIEQCRPGNRLGDISHAVQEVVEARRLRRRPRAGRPRRRPRDARGSADPQLRPARPRAQAVAGHGVRDRADDHRRQLARCAAATTAGRSTLPTAALAAHCEHTVAVTADGPRVLTRREPAAPGGGGMIEFPFAQCGVSALCARPASPGAHRPLKESSQ